MISIWNQRRGAECTQAFALYTKIIPGSQPCGETWPGSEQEQPRYPKLSFHSLLAFYQPPVFCLSGDVMPLYPKEEYAGLTMTQVAVMS